jgi:hypothetical protein
MNMEHTEGKMIVEIRTPMGEGNLFVEKNEYGHREYIGSTSGNAHANAARLALCWNTHDDLVEALEAAESHLDYCGYGDEWERECAEGLPEKIASALSAARGEK